MGVSVVDSSRPESGRSGFGFLPTLFVFEEGHGVSDSKAKLTLFPFFQVGLGWLLAGSVISVNYSETSDLRWIALRWVFILWVICLADLLSLAKLMDLVLKLMGGDQKNQIELVIRASSWGTAKLACMGSLGFVLYHGRVVPVPALLSGLATMFVVPIAGGAWWYQRVLGHGRTWL